MKSSFKVKLSIALLMICAAFLLSRPSTEPTLTSLASVNAAGYSCVDKLNWDCLNEKTGNILFYKWRVNDVVEGEE